MDNFEEHYFGIFEIDHIKDKAVPSDVKTETGALKEWLTTIIFTILDSNKKEYIFTEDTVQVSTCANKIINGDTEDYPQQIADRLLAKEKIAQEKIKGFQYEVKKGSLLQLSFTLKETKYFLLAKVEQIPFLDNSDLEKHVGLPFKNHIFKACLILVDENNTIDTLFIYDSNTSISKYWWDDFLETEEINSNEKNTKICYESIDKLLRKELAKKSLSDYTELKNNINGYFISNKNFNMDDFVKTIIEDYNPESKDIDLNNIKEKVLQLPEKNNYDSKFEIEKKAIRKYFKQNISLSNHIELKLTDNIPNLKSIISSYETGGQKYILIKTDKGFEYFKKLEEKKEKVVHGGNQVPAETIC